MPRTPARPVVVASKVAASQAAEPGWASDLRHALREVREAEKRHAHARDRLPLLRQEEEAARRALSSAEAAIAFSRGTDADLAHARQRAEAAEAERAKGERLATGLAEVVEHRRANLAPLAEAAGPAFAAWSDERLAEADARFGTAITEAMKVLVEAVALAEAAGAGHVVDPLLRVRLPGSLLRADVVHAAGRMSGKTEPASTAVSAQAGALMAVVQDAIRAATPREADRHAA